jgi:integral membrane protein (TIGR01906 family)
MKTVDKILAITAMFALIIALLLTSFQVAIYGDPEYKFYRRLYEKYNVTESLDMKMEDVMIVTDHMMDYLIGRELELSIVTDVDGEIQDFFNEQDRLHMFDVMNLFTGGLRIRNGLLVFFAALIVILKTRKVKLKELLPKAYSIAFAVFLGILAFLGIAFTVDFTKCFTIFHEIFFTNDLWLFDARYDYMIRMLPEGFFADMLFRILKFFVGFLGWVLAFMIIWKRSDKNKQ